MVPTEKRFPGLRKRSLYYCANSHPYAEGGKKRIGRTPEIKRMFTVLGGKDFGWARICDGTTTPS